MILKIINNYKSSIINGRTFKLNKSEKDIANVVSKAIIEKSGSYNLTYNKYLDDDFNYQGKWPFIELSEIAEFVRGPFGSSIKKSVCVPKNKDTYKVYEQGNVIQNNFNIGEYYIDSDKFKELKRFELKAKDIVVTCAGTLGKIVIVPDKIERGVINSVLMRIRLNRSKVNDEFFVHLFKSNIFQKRITKNATGAGVTNMFATSELKKFKIPLPPLSIQEHIVAEIRKHNELIKNLAEKIKNEESHIEMTIENIWK